MKSLEVDVVSFEISHISLAMVKQKLNVIILFSTCHVDLHVSRYRQCSE